DGGGRRHIANRSHAIEFGRLWRYFYRRRRLFKTDHSQDRTISTELHIRSDTHLDRGRHLLPIDESAKARFGVGDQAAPLGKLKLGVPARNHWPIVLRKEI